MSRAYFSVIKRDEKTAVLEFYGAYLYCRLCRFPKGVEENDLVYFENGFFIPDEERTLREKKENRRRLDRILGRGGRDPH